MLYSSISILNIIWDPKFLVFDFLEDTIISSAIQKCFQLGNVLSVDFLREKELIITKDHFTHSLNTGDSIFSEIILNLVPNLVLESFHVEAACRSFSFPLIQWLLLKNPTLNTSRYFKDYSNVFISAINGGKFEFLKQAYEIRETLQIGIFSASLAATASSTGNLEILKWYPSFYFFFLKDKTHFIIYSRIYGIDSFRLFIDETKNGTKNRKKSTSFFISEFSTPSLFYLHFIFFPFKE